MGLEDDGEEGRAAREVPLVELVPCRHGVSWCEVMVYTSQSIGRRLKTSQSINARQNLTGAGRECRVQDP